CLLVLRPLCFIPFPYTTLFRSELADAVDETRVGILLLAGRIQVEDRLGVGRGREDRALLLQGTLDRAGVGEIAVMGNRKAAVGQFREEGLDVAEARAARCRIARMANRAATVKALDNGWLCEVVADQADVPLDKELA